MPISGEYEPSTWKVAADQVALYESSGGTEGTVLNGAPCVVLWTRGRQSGKVRKSPVIRVTDGVRYAALGSMGGAPNHPNWYRNLLDDPQVSLQDGPTLADYTARVLDGAEREEWWARAVAVWPAYDEYQSRTERVIPVVLLDPVATPAG